MGLRNCLQLSSVTSRASSVTSKLVNLAQANAGVLVDLKPLRWTIRSFGPDVRTCLDRIGGCTHLGTFASGRIFSQSYSRDHYGDEPCPGGPEAMEGRL